MNSGIGIQKLVTNHNPFVMINSSGVSFSYEFTMYCKTIDYYVQPFHCHLGILEGLVKLPTYGLIVRKVTEFSGENASR